METIIKNDVQSDSAPMIIDKIMNEHHDYFKYNLPIISTILNSAMRFDKKTVKNLELINKHFVEFKELLEAHIAEEKYILFPVLQKLSLEEEKELDFKAAELKNIYRKIWNEINKLSSLLKQINQLTNNYNPADNVSQSLKQCFWDLKMLDLNCKKYFILEKKHLLLKLIINEKF